MEETLEGSDHLMALRPSVRLALVTPQELNRYTLADLMQVMFGEDKGAYRAALYPCPAQ